MVVRQIRLTVSGPVLVVVRMLLKLAGQWAAAVVHSPELLMLCSLDHRRFRLASAAREKVVLA